MKFLEFNMYPVDEDIMELYSLNDWSLNGLIDEFVKCHDEVAKKQLIEEILFTLDDIVDEDKFHQIEDRLKKYISEEK